MYQKLGLLSSWFMELCISRLVVVSHEVTKKQSACASSGPHDHYSELFTRMAALKFESTGWTMTCGFALLQHRIRWGGCIGVWVTDLWSRCFSSMSTIFTRCLLIQRGATTHYLKNCLFMPSLWPESWEHITHHLCQHPLDNCNTM